MVRRDMTMWRRKNQYLLPLYVYVIYYEKNGKMTVLGNDMGKAGIIEKQFPDLESAIEAAKWIKSWTKSPEKIIIQRKKSKSAQLYYAHPNSDLPFPRPMIENPYGYNGIPGQNYFTDRSRLGMSPFDEKPSHFHNVIKEDDLVLLPELPASTHIRKLRRKKHIKSKVKRKPVKRCKCK